MEEFVRERFGVSVVGGCCGTTPEHIRALVERVARGQAEGARGADVPRLSSGIRDHRPGAGARADDDRRARERAGLRKVKRLLLADDYDGMLEVARADQESGAHVLDVCVALTERQDEAEQMRRWSSSSRRG
jgi:5-methyltetrahydrofolate--homocysteine methyltransferase